jgi:hypothetical protein
VLPVANRDDQSFHSLHKPGMGIHRRRSSSNSNNNSNSNSSSSNNKQAPQSTTKPLRSKPNNKLK